MGSSRLPLWNDLMHPTCEYPGCVETVSANDPFCTRHIIEWAHSSEYRRYTRIRIQERPVNLGRLDVCMTDFINRTVKERAVRHEINALGIETEDIVTPPVTG
jgi:hypothetical protein